MRKLTLSLLLMLFVTVSVLAQTKIDFKEFTLENGLHVIMHQDNSTPIVAVNVFYHVGSKNENPERTGFAHFFEHLMFEGSEYIPRGKFFEYIESAGGTLNAGTSYDYTTYFEVMPTNQLELALWMEAERMLHAKVDEIGVSTQRDVIKEEMKQVMEERPYGTFIKEITARLYPNHPYNSPVIGSAAHLDAATLEEFIEFYKTFYVPNNAVLVVAGDISYDETERLVRKYYADIPMGTKDMYRPDIEIQPLTAEIRDVVYDNIQLPAVFKGYLMPEKGHPDNYALELLGTYLLGGKSSIMYKEIVDGKQLAVQAQALPFDLEDGGMFIIMAFANLGKDTDELIDAIDEVLVKVKEEGIDERELEKLINIQETQKTNSLGSILNVALQLSEAKVMQNDANYINTSLDNYRKVTTEDIKRVANKYLVPNRRVVLTYLPKPTESTE